MTRMSCWLAIWLLAVPAAGHAADGLTVQSELWDRPRTAKLVAEQPAVKQSVSAYLAQPAAQLAIHHGLGQDALLQAEELRAWLMALAVDDARIRLINDLKPTDPIMIEVTQ